MWRSSPQQYARKYFSEEDGFSTVESRYGNEIGGILERGEHKRHPVLRRVPRYVNTEEEVEAMIEGVRVVGHIDSFSRRRKAIIEYKTGHRSKEGKAPWTASRVQRHDQLPLYSLLVKETYGRVHPLVRLVWIETQFAQKCETFDGHTLCAETRELELTSDGVKRLRIPQ